MPIQVTEPLFAWDCLEDSCTLKTSKQLLGGLPGAALVDWLTAARGIGRKKRDGNRAIFGPYRDRWSKSGEVAFAGTRFRDLIYMTHVYG